MLGWSYACGVTLQVVYTLLDLQLLYLGWKLYIYVHACLIIISEIIVHLYNYTCTVAGLVVYTCIV